MYRHKAQEKLFVGLKAGKLYIFSCQKAGKMHLSNPSALIYSKKLEKGPCF